METGATITKLLSLFMLMVASKGTVTTLPDSNVTSPESMQISDVAEGKHLYETTCKICHGVGIAGSPKTGDKSAWQSRIKQGKAVLYQHAIKGYQGEYGTMPSKGGSTASDAQVKAAVDYMVAQVH